MKSYNLKDVEEKSKQLDYIHLTMCIISDVKHIEPKDKWPEKWVCAVQFMGGQFNYVSIDQEQFSYLKDNQDKTYAVLLDCKLKDGYIRPFSIDCYKLV